MFKREIVWSSEWKECARKLKCVKWQEIAECEQEKMLKLMVECEEKLTEQNCEWEVLDYKVKKGIEKEGKNVRMQIQAQKRKKFGKAGNCKLSRQEECDVAQEITMRLKIAELELKE